MKHAVDVTPRGYESPANGGARPPGGLSSVELDQWATRLLGAPARVHEATSTRAVAVRTGAAEPIVSSVDYDYCPCRAFERRACVGCLGRPSCLHTRQLARMRKALAAKEEAAGLDEIRRIAAGTDGESTGARESPFPPAAPARPAGARR